jgi:hypothetical protein
MTFKFLKIMGIGFILSVKKLLPILFLFTGFQANAVVIGNLTYDGTYISGDGRTYVGLDTIAAWDYATTLAATQVNGEYEEFRIANTADADYFIASLFGADADNCSTVDGTWSNDPCGTLAQWTDGALGANYDLDADRFFFIGDEGPQFVGLTQISGQSYNTGDVKQYEFWGDLSNEARYADEGSQYDQPVPWLLVRGSVVAVSEPSVIAIMALGIFGIGLARRRRQS